MHKHRAVTKFDKIVGWTHCVARQIISACDGMAHGGVILYSKCSCGAERRIESNGRHQASSGWVGGKYSQEE